MGTAAAGPGAVKTTVAPWLSVRGSAKAVEFYKAAFGATEAFRIESPSGSVVARLAVDGAEFWVGDESPEHKNFSPETIGGGSVRMVLTVADPDAVFARDSCRTSRLGPEEERNYPASLLTARQDIHPVGSLRFLFVLLEGSP